VKTNGEIKWHGGRVYLSESLRGEPVGLIPVDDRYWSIQFGPLHIGLLDAYANRTLYSPTIVLPMSPVVHPTKSRLSTQSQMRASAPLKPTTTPQTIMTTNQR